MNPELAQLDELLAYLTPEEQKEVDLLLTEGMPEWVELPGPQREAFESEADIVFYGGAAGGGKTDLAVGLALTQHKKSLILRRESTQLIGIVERMTEIVGNRDGYNGSEKIWRLPDRHIEFGSVKDLGDEQKFQGRPHDLLVFDEITHFLESQVRFLMGWLRTTVPGQRCRVLFTGNPPTDSDGEWVIQFFGPWLDPEHPDPAKPGELRWYAMIDGKETPVKDGTPIEHQGKTIRPKSRTFIPSRVTDNPFLMTTDYESQLQALPEPLRSQMLYGDFRAGRGTDPWQVIPTAWVEAAMNRWKEDGGHGVPMDSVGADIARGGKDEDIVAARHGTWFAPLQRWAGKDTPDGPASAGHIISVLRDAAPIHIDVVGVGSSPYDILKGNGLQVIPVSNANSAKGMCCRRGVLRFRNVRAWNHWALREALDPVTGDNLALPPDPKLKADLCAPRWEMTAGGIQIESKDGVRDRIGRSPDSGDAVILANLRTPKLAAIRQQQVHEQDYDPFDGLKAGR